MNNSKFFILFFRLQVDIDDKLEKKLEDLYENVAFVHSNWKISDTFV